MNDIKKAALVEEGQPASNEALNTQKDYHKDTELSNERDRALEWLHKMAEASKNHEFKKDIWVSGIWDGICMVGAAKMGNIIGCPIEISYAVDGTIRIENFTFEDVMFYELIRIEEEE